MNVPRKTDRHADWLIPAGLIVLSLVPMLAGGVRLAELFGGAPVTPANERFFAAPMPVVLHIVSSIGYSLLGAFQFAPGMLRRKRAWHRNAGRILVPLGLVSALSGLWMTLFYPWPEFDGIGLYVIRLLVGITMIAALVLAVSAVRKRDIPRHRAWMMRAYALGLGAGTQVFTHIPYFVFPSIQGELARTLCMAAGWVLNLAVAEWIIRTQPIMGLASASVPSQKAPVGQDA